MMETEQFNDLAELALERTQKAAALVLQLMETDEERAALLMAIAVHFIDGATQMTSASTKPTSAEYVRTMKLVFESFGIHIDAKRRRSNEQAKEQ